MYPQGIRIQAKQYATHIEKEDTDLVTVSGETYRMYRYTTYAIHIGRTKKLESIIEFVYIETPDGIPLEQIKRDLQVA